MGKRRLRLRTKLLLISACMIFIPLTTLSFHVLSVTKQSIVDAYCNDQISTIKKAGAATNNMLNEIEKTSLLVITNDQLRSFLTEPTTLENKWNAYSLMAYLKNSSDVISSLQLLGTGDHVLTLGDRPGEITEANKQTAIQYNGRVYWGAQQAGSGVPDIYMCRLIRDVLLPTEHIGFIKIYLDADALIRGLYNDNSPSATYYILDANGTVIYRSREEAAPELPSMARLKKNNATCMLETDHGRSITPYSLSSGELTLVGVSGTESITQQVRANALLYTGLSLSCFLFCLILSVFLSTRTLRPLTQLITHMHRLECEDFDTRIEPDGDEETSELAAQFNRMAAKIQSLIEKVYAVSLRRKEAELRALQTQIKPHFLYNTLDTAYWIAQQENAPMTAEYIRSLSQFFRCGLITDSDCTTVENELEHLCFYIMLQRQHNPSFDFNQDVEPEALSCSVVKLVLQPLVENAILHGIAESDAGRIDVRIFREGDALVYTISDNGVGIDEAALNRILTGQQTGAHGIGLRNVNDRIRLVFGEAYGIHVQNRDGGGTQIRVTQPFIKRGEPDD